MRGTTTTARAVLLLLPLLAAVALLALGGDAIQDLDYVDFKWWIASKLALPIPPGRPKQIECVRSQLNCSSQTEFVLTDFRDSFGMGSCLLDKVSTWLTGPSVARGSAQVLMYGWQYGNACSNASVPPFECLFEPVCSHTNQVKVKQPGTIGHDSRGHFKTLEERCDATYEEAASGIMQHVRLLDPALDNFDDDGGGGAAGAAAYNPHIREQFCPSSTPPTADYAAVHMRVRKGKHEYTDLRDLEAVKSPLFWNELLRQLGAIHQHLYIATDHCVFAKNLTLPPGLNCYSTCGEAQDDSAPTVHKLATNSVGHLSDYQGLRIDLFRMRHARHFYADFNRCAMLTS
jgi:hypothetical protein